MTKRTAKVLSSLMVAMGRDLNKSLELVRSSETEEGLIRYRESISKLTLEILIGVMNPIYAEYPDLKPPEMR